MKENEKKKDGIHTSFPFRVERTIQELWVELLVEANLCGPCAARFEYLQCDTNENDVCVCVFQMCVIASSEL